MTIVTETAKGLANQPRHWAMGPSKSDRIAKCPGAVRECAKYPDDPSGDAATDGTHSHTLLERSLQAGMFPEAFLGERLGDHEGSFVVQADRCERVAVACEYVYDLMSALTDPVLYVEILVFPGEAVNLPDWKGTSDIIISAKEGLWILDYKDGFRSKGADSWQLVDYAIGALNLFPLDPKRTEQRITLGIIQPKDFANPIKVRVHTQESFQLLADKSIAFHQAAAEPDAPTIAGPHCDDFCPAAKPGRCKAFNGAVTDTINEQFGHIPPPPSAGAEGATTLAVNPPILTIPEAESMTSDAISHVLDMEPLILSWLKGVRAEGLQRHKGGDSIPRYKTIRGNTQRKFSQPEAEMHKAFKSMHLPKGLYTASKIRSPAQILALDPVKKWRKSKLEKLLALIEKPRGALKLVPETDSAKEVRFDLLDDIPPPPEEGIPAPGTSLPATPVQEAPTESNQPKPQEQPEQPEVPALSFL